MLLRPKNTSKDLHVLLILVVRVVLGNVPRHAMKNVNQVLKLFAPPKA